MKQNIYLFDKDGNFVTDESYQEIHTLDKMLSEAKIPHTVDTFMDGWQICYPSDERRVCDVIEHFGSYGSEDDLLEIMGLCDTEDVVEGFLTAAECFKRIKEHWKSEGVV